MDNILENIVFDHIGIAVEDLNSAVEDLKRSFNLTDISAVYNDEYQNVKVVFANLHNTPLELIAPLDINKKTPIRNILDKGFTFYHLCYKTNNIKLTLERLVDNGAILLGEPFPAIAFNNNLIAFVMVENLGLIELVEVNKPELSGT